MKKRLMALALAVCLLCSVLVSASGETLYDLLLAIMSNPQGEDFYVGTPTTGTMQGQYRFCMVMYDEDKQQLTLGTYDKFAYWSNVPAGKGLFLIYKYCAGWSVLEEQLDSGYQLVLVMKGGDDTLTIQSASEAAAFASWLEAQVSGN